MPVIWDARPYTKKPCKAVKCPECMEEGKDSYVYVHCINKSNHNTITEYDCSNKHSWKVEE